MKTSAPLTRETLDAAKDRVSVAAAWLALGCQGTPPKDGGNSRSPFRNGDNRSAFGISRCGRLWSDRVTGASGDVVTFIMVACNCSIADAIKALYQMAGLSPSDGTFAKPVITKSSAPAKPEKPRQLPRLRMPTITELATIAKLRGFPTVAGLECMVSGGMLRASDTQDGDEWDVPHIVVTDSTRKTMLCRRVDGLKMALWDDDSKEWTQRAGPKSKARVALSGDLGPIGFPLITDATRTVFVVEGSPDGWALHTLAFDAGAHRRRDWALIVMPATSTNFTAAQLAILSGRRIVIIPHDDKNAKPTAKRDWGEEAAMRWAEALHASGAKPMFFHLRSRSVNYLPPLGKDLCDATSHGFTSRNLDDSIEPPPINLSVKLFSLLETESR